MVGTNFHELVDAWFYFFVFLRISGVGIMGAVYKQPDHITHPDPEQPPVGRTRRRLNADSQ